MLANLRGNLYVQFLVITSCFTVPLLWKKRPKFSTEKPRSPHLFSRNLLYPLVNITDLCFISSTQIFVLCLSITSARHCKFLHIVPTSWMAYFSTKKTNSNIRISYSRKYNHSKKEYILCKKINDSVGSNKAEQY